MRRLTPKQLVRHYGSQRAAGEALGVTQQAVSLWKQRGVIPRQLPVPGAARHGRVRPGKEMRTPGKANIDWQTGDNNGYEAATLEVLMDVRRELMRLNGLLHCPNFIGIPLDLAAINRNTKSRRNANRG